MTKLSGKIAVITGGTSGIGAATAKRFQHEGATVVVTGSNPETLEAARKELTGIDVMASEVADIEATRGLFEQIKATHGQIDILFVNAAIAKFAPHTMVDEAFFDAQFNINVKGAYFTLKYASPLIRDGGSVILTSSISGVRGDEMQTVYAATKAAVRSFGRTFAAEMAPRRIRVNTISPGPIQTPIFGKVGLTTEQMQGMLASILPSIPLKRMGQSEEIAAAAVYFASDESSFTTGTELFVDGGMASL